MAWLVLPLGSISFRKGAPASRESSPEITRVFCRGCGTQLCHRDERKNHLGVTLASLDDPAAFAPTRERSEAQRFDWLAPL